ncbi:MAG: LptF/LptG family permease [Planctomycetaceae bacterium]
MFTTFDRYLLRRFLAVFVILFLSTYGLFVVIDGFTNVDGFQEGADGAGQVMSRMAAYYAYQASLFLNMIGAILAEISVMVVFTLLVRGSELHPILASGVPTYRLLAPVLAGVMFVTLAMMANQELVMPRIAHELQAPRDQDKKGAHEVEPIYDAALILIGGKELFPLERKMIDAEFVLPVPTIVGDLTNLKAAEAEYREETAERPGGWILRNVTPRFDEIDLTDTGRQIVLCDGNPSEVFVVTDVSYDLLYNRNRGYKFVSTPELVERIRNPSTGTAPVRGQLLHLHTRLTQPLLNLSVALCAVPLIVRRESRSLVGNLAACTGVMGVLLAVLQGFLYLGSVNLLNPDLAAWAPVIVCGTLAAYLTGVVQT